MAACAGDIRNTQSEPDMTMNNAQMVEAKLERARLLRVSPHARRLARFRSHTRYSGSSEFGKGGFARLQYARCRSYRHQSWRSQHGRRRPDWRVDMQHQF